MAIQLEVSHPGGPPHEVELAGPVAVLGRDPSCDLVLSDTKCSRRHAVLEEGPDGLVIRDAGSANGTYVNGRRQESSPLRPGDTVRIGETTLRVKGDAGETIVLAPHDLQVPGEPSAGPAAGRPPVPATEPARRRPPGPRRGPPPLPRPAPPTPRQQPPTLRLLQALWVLAAPSWMIGSLVLALRAGVGPLAVAAAGSGLALGGLSVAMALGLRAGAQWAWRLQVAVAAGGLLVCPFTFAAATTLVYVLRPDVRIAFEDGRPRDAPVGAGPAEPTFALSLLGTLALGLALTALALLTLRGR
jgi:hypothetical protein